MTSRINWLATLGAGVLYFMLGALWYAPFAFGPTFNEALGYAPGVVPANTPSMFIGPLLGCLAAVMGLSVLINWTGVTSRKQILQLAATTSLLFSVSAVGIDAVAPNQHASLTLLLIVGGYHVVGQLLAGLVLSMKKRP